MGRFIQVCTGKIHRATVTGAELHYSGSVVIAEELMRAARIHPGQCVHVNGIRNGMQWITYAVPGEDGQLDLNGPPANLFEPGDLVVINAWAWVQADAFFMDPGVPLRVVHVSHENEIVSQELHRAGWGFKEGSP